MLGCCWIVAAADCEDAEAAAAAGGDKFFQVAVPAPDPAAVVAVKEVGALLRASVQRQRGLSVGLQPLVPKPASCKRSQLKSKVGQRLCSSLGAQPELEETLAARAEQSSQVFPQRLQMCLARLSLSV